MQVTHARLFQNLARLTPAVVRIEPTDLPHAFILAYGKGETSLKLATPADQTCDASIKGKLEPLLDMLEGRSDGDMMFFSRDIDISGDTSVIVGLRNTLDREEINLLDDVASLCGPLAVPARRAFGLVNRVAERVMNRLAELHAARENGPTHAKNSALENDRLRAEIKTLKTRLAKFEVRQKQKASR
jgi:predicted lipid carrier protein YhbT